MTRLRMTFISFMIVYGSALILALTVIFMIVLSMLFGGALGMLIALGACAALGGLWSYLDERRIEREYREDQ